MVCKTTTPELLNNVPFTNLVTNVTHTHTDTGTPSLRLQVKFLCTKIEHELYNSLYTYDVY